METPPPRAFAQGTGVLLQAVGMILFLSTCCVCSLAGAWDPVLSRPVVLKQLEEHTKIGLSVTDLPDQPGKAGLMLTVMFMTVGGLALAGFGLGLQSERPHAASAALATNLLMICVLVLAGIGLWIGESSWLTRLWHTMITLVILTTTGFTWIALQEIRANPPPKEIPPADPSI